MNLIFENGTVQQQDWLVQALDHATYPWDRMTTIVRVEWVPSIQLPKLHHSFAATEYLTDQRDACGRINACKILIRDDLDDPHRLGNEAGNPVGTYAGRNFYYETVMHEMGHVHQAKMTDEQVLRLNGQVFGGTQRSEWDGPDLKWWEQRRESDAETFKDVWLPKPYRKFDNRTKHRMAPQSFDTWLSVENEICPCRNHDECIEEQIAYGQRSGGDIGFDPIWFNPQDPETNMSLLGPSHPSTVFNPPILPWAYALIRVRWGGIGYQVGMQEFILPNPYWNPTHAPLLFYRILFYDRGDGLMTWRFLGQMDTDTSPDAPGRFYWDPTAPSLVPHQVGWWRAIGGDGPAPEFATGSGFVPEWWLASIKLCGPVIIT